uniref:peptidyl-tRNA hydrolase n=1 Tax=Meleagris gallopavo TaxID=9103 RepID=A0A803XYZ9_MELGA
MECNRQASRYSLSSFRAYLYARKDKQMSRNNVKAELIQVGLLTNHSLPPGVLPALTARFVCPQAPDEAALTALAQTLQQHSIDHEVWTEQPENIPSCLALRPYPKDQVHPHLKKFKLLK